MRKKEPKGEMDKKISKGIEEKRCRRLLIGLFEETPNNEMKKIFQNIDQGNYLEIKGMYLNIQTKKTYSMPEKNAYRSNLQKIKLLDLKGKENVGIYIKISGQRKSICSKPSGWLHIFHTNIPFSEQHSNVDKYIKKIKSLSKNFTAGQYEYTESRK